MQKGNKVLTLGLLILTGLPQWAYSKTLDSVQMPEKVKVGTRPLVLNGMGTRKATFLKVKVYVAGLYLESPSKDPSQILDSNQFKRLDMQFVHDAPVEKINSAWSDSFKVNCKTQCEELRPSLEKLNGFMASMKENDRMLFTFYPDALEIRVKDQPPQRIEGKEFQRIILATWLGAEPPNESLKTGLLGLES